MPVAPAWRRSAQDSGRLSAPERAANGRMGHDPDVDVRDGVEGYPAMPPVPEPVLQGTGPQDDRPGPVAPVRDHLLSVTSAADAGAALDASESLDVVESRAAAWTVLAQLLYIGAFITLFGAVGGIDVPVVVPYLGFLGLLLLSVGCTHVSGVQLKPPRGKVIVACLLVGVAAVIASVALDLADGWYPGFLVACAVGAVASQAVKWIWSWRRGSHPGWGPGTQAFAILTMLDGVRAVTPSYLVDRAGLDGATGDLWIERLRAEHLLMGGETRRRPLGRDWIRITDTGRERLARMRLELERQAATEVSVG